MEESYRIEQAFMSKKDETNRAASIEMKYTCCTNLCKDP